MKPVSIHRLGYGYFVRPPDETGTGAPRVEPCLGYLVIHPRGTLLFDTGMGSDPEVDVHYRPRRASVLAALAATGHRTADIDLVTNCHNATAFAADLLARRAHQDGHAQPLPVVPDWIDRLLQFDPARVVFAHDHSVWQA